MKLIFKTGLAALLAAGLALRATAQEKFTIVKAGGNLLTILQDGQGDIDKTYGGITAAAEHQIGQKFSLGLGINFNVNADMVRENNLVWTEKQTLVSFEPEGRWYPKTATDGFYLGFAPSVILFRFKTSGAINLSSQDTQVGLNLKTGYQFVLMPKLTLQLGTGFGVLLPNSDIDPSALIHLNLLLGYRF